MKQDDAAIPPSSSGSMPSALSRPTGHSEPNLDCRDVFERYQAGEQKAASEFVSRYRAPIFSYLQRWGLQQSVCEDLFQEAFVKIHVGRMGYDPTRSLPTWVFTIVVNVMRDHWRKHRLEDEELSDKLLTEENEAASRQSDLTDRLSTRQWLERELSKLPTQQREVLLLCCVQELTMEEAGLAMGVPANTVKTLLRRGRQLLAERMVRYNELIERQLLERQISDREVLS